MKSLIICPHLVTREEGSCKDTFEDELTEFKALAKSLPSLNIVNSVSFKLTKIYSATLLGSGKILQVNNLINRVQIKLVVINTIISPIQQRNLEREWGVKVLDRTALILEIFGARASSREGVLQVELAHLEYQRTRLVRSWTHLERQRGGTGFLGGPGETQIEADRRAISEKVVNIKRKLKKISETRKLHRAGRKKSEVPVVALVGYTNAGKSTLFNYFTGSHELARNMLFATLDSKMRSLTLQGDKNIIFSDTVGFITNLPTQLISAFRSTLEEIINADLILHVRDISHDQSKAQAAAVKKIIFELPWGRKEIPQIIEIYNKIDLLSIKEKNLLMNKCANSKNKILFSSKTGEGYEYLENIMKKTLFVPQNFEQIFLSFSQINARSWFIKNRIKFSEEIKKDGYLLNVSWSESDKNRFLAYSRC